MEKINQLDTITALMRALSAMLQPTAEAMRSGGIKNLSMSDGKFVIQLENGHVFDGTVYPGQNAGDPAPDLQNRASDPVNFAETLEKVGA